MIFASPQSVLTLSTVHLREGSARHSSRDLRQSSHTAATGSLNDLNEVCTVTTNCHFSTLTDSLHGTQGPLCSHSLLSNTGKPKWWKTKQSAFSQSVPTLSTVHFKLSLPLSPQPFLRHNLSQLCQFMIREGVCTSHPTRPPNKQSTLLTQGHCVTLEGICAVTVNCQFSTRTDSLHRVHGPRRCHSPSSTNMQTKMGNNKQQ